MPHPTTPDERTPLIKDQSNGQHNQEGQDDSNVSSGSVEDGDVPLADEPSTLSLITIMSSVWLGTFLAALDSTLVATLATPISASFSSLSLLSWLASAYFIANAALQPLSGKLTDIYGRRAGLIFSNVFFCAGNLICGLAKAEWVIIFGRVVAGMGGGGLTAISTFIASDLVPLRRRGVWQGFGNIAYGLGSALGGIFGGAINDSIGWRWAFLIQVPLTLVSGIIVVFTVKIPVKESSTSKIKRIDYLGAITLVLTLVLLLVGLNSGGNSVPWTHPLVLASLPASAVCLGIFIYIEANVAHEPIIPVRIMVNQTVLSACFTNWFDTMALFSVLFYAPLYFQLRDYTPTQAGVRMVPQSVGVGLGSIGTGLLIKKMGRYWYLNIAVQSILLLSFALVTTFDLDTPNWPPFVYFFLGGVGYAGMLTISLIALISAVEHKFQAVITSASYAFRSTGSTIGITISSAVFQNVLKKGLWSRLGDRPDADKLIPSLRDSLDVIKTLNPKLKAIVLDVYMQSFRAVFGTILGMAIIGAIVSLFLREHKLHSTLSRNEDQNEE